jgi:signal peptidase I
MAMAVSRSEQMTPARLRAARREGITAAPFSRRLFQWVTVLVLSLLCYLFVSRCFVQIVRVQGESMVPTLRDSDTYVLNHWIYYLHPPQRGDVVVLKDPSDGGCVVKRIIAKDGDFVRLKNGRVYVNGRELKESYLPSSTPTYPAGVGEQLIVCGHGRYFVLGDNRNNSYDSRMYGPVPRANILGMIRF